MLRTSTKVLDKRSVIYTRKAAFATNMTLEDEGGQHGCAIGHGAKEFDSIIHKNYTIDINDGLMWYDIVGRR